MSVLATAVRELIALGVGGEALAAAVERLEEAAQAENCRTLAEAVAAATRAADAHLQPEDPAERRRRLARERQTRYRASRSERHPASPLASPSVTLRDSDVTRDAPLPPETKSPPEPPKKTQPSNPPPSPPTGVVSPSAKASPLGKRLPADWRPDELDLGGPGGMSPTHVSSELDKFRDYWRAVPGAKGRKLDWDATWRNWLRRAAEDHPRPMNGHDPSPRHHDRKHAAHVERLEDIDRAMALAVERSAGLRGSG